MPPRAGGDADDTIGKCAERICCATEGICIIDKTANTIGFQFLTYLKIFTHKVGDPLKLVTKPMIEPDRRRFPRFRTIKQARVYFDADNVQSVLCKVRNLSEFGAGIEFDEAVKYTKIKALFFLNENLMVPAELQWTTGRRAGVRFLKPLAHFTKQKVDLRSCEPPAPTLNINQT